jgi:hypothetical protein
MQHTKKAHNDIATTPQSRAALFLDLDAPDAQLAVVHGRLVA